MTDYHPLIARAVEGLAKNTGEARRALYERARAALVAQLRAVEPALPESEITKERLALEEAIRKVESEATRKALVEPRAPVRTEAHAAPSSPPRLFTGGGRAQNPLDGAPLRRERSNAATAELPRAARSELRSEPKSELRREPKSDLRRESKDEPLQPQVPRPAENRGASDEAQGPQPDAKPSARSRILEARTSALKAAGLKGFRSIAGESGGPGAATAKAPQTDREAPHSYAPASPQRAAPIADIPADPLADRLEPHGEEEEFPPAADDSLHLRSLEPSYDDQEEDEEPPPRSLRTHASRMAEMEEGEDEEEYEEPPSPRSYGGWVKAALLLLFVFAVAATAWGYRANIAALYHFAAQMRSQPPAPTAQNPPPQQKFTGRVPQEEAPGQAPVAGTSPGNSQQAPQVAQHAVLYEADPNDPQGKRFAGSVVWRTETVSPGPGLAPELAVRADISIPERHMTVTWSLRRNTDKALPASHTIEIMFSLPPDFPGGGISNVPGILMKDSEEVRGMPLAGLAVKVTNGFFLIGLNAADADMQRNIQLLKERGWFDILIVYNNGSRAILTLEKGPPGEHAFADAFAAWGQ